MKVIVLSAILGVSFIAACLSVVLMNWIFWTSLLVLACTSVYINKHEAELNSELDEIFGKDDYFVD